jgi:hypothetical protein
VVPLSFHFRNRFYAISGNRRRGTVGTYQEEITCASVLQSRDLREETSRLTSALREYRAREPCHVDAKATNARIETAVLPFQKRRATFKM